MKDILVIGAGVVGVTTAYELASRGHRVTVVDRCEAVAAAASFANAGLLSAGGVSPAAARGLRPWLLRGLWSHDAALRWRPSASPAAWRWLAAWWGACGKPHEDHVRAMVGLAHTSLARLQAISQLHELQYERSPGVLMLMRDEREFLPTRRHVEMLREFGVQALEVTPERARQIEPGLSASARLAGGVYLPDDGVGNCRQFTQLLREVCESRLGVRFLFNREVDGLQRKADRWEASTQVSGVPGLDRPASAATETLCADTVVLCTGAAGVQMMPALVRHVPVWAVTGQSLSFALKPDQPGPRSAIVDIRPGVTLSRLGNRLRVTGGFRLATTPTGPGATEPIDDEELQPLTRCLERWFPGSVLRSQAQVWRGARPMLPDGPPRIGPTPLPGLWLNLGHGAHGWTLACGAAQLLAAQIDGARKDRVPVDPHAFQIA